MRRISLVILAIVAIGFCSPVDGAFYGDPPDAHHPWAIHDMNRPKPPLVQPGSFSTPEKPGTPPSDAIVLFDGSNLDQWCSAKQPGGPAEWIVQNGYVEVKPGKGDIQTKEEFGDCQLHVEWAAPAKVEGESQGRGNSGVFLMGLCEVQVLDNYDNASYSDGYASSIYGVNPPLANPLRAPGQFQVYDIIFRRPIYRDGRQIDPGYVTVFVNGVLTQDHTPLEGPTGHIKRTTPGPFPEKGPLKLQDHRNPVRFRNIWYRKLPPRAVEGGTDGMLTPEAAMAKRADIAAEIVADAGKMPKGSREQMLRLAEALCYQKDPATASRVEAWIRESIEQIRQTPAGQLDSKKDDVKSLQKAFDYLGRHNILPAAAQPAAELQALIKARKWDK